MADLIPVIRGELGGREYYIGKMTFQELSAKVQFYTDLESDPELDSLLQRELSKRSEDMKTYLLNQPERFYGAIIVAAWGGKPAYVRVKMEDHPLLDDDFEFGLLKFDGRQQFFALDGQHRLRSIKDAIEENGDLRSEEVSVVFVTHDRTEVGNIKTRRLFHTLNRYARPTTTGENIALDEDNVISICTRMLLKSGIVFLGPSYIEHQRKNLTRTQVGKFTSLASLFDFNKAVLDAIYPFDKDYLRFRPDASHVENIYSTISQFWIELRERVEELRQVESQAKTPGEIREPEEPGEGHLLFRPVGLKVYGNVLGMALAEDSVRVECGAAVDAEVCKKALDRVASLPLAIGELPWRGTIFRGGKIATGPWRLAMRMACYMLDVGQLAEGKLLEDYRSHLDDEQAELPARLK